VVEGEVSLGEFACAFKNIVYTEGRPVQLLEVTLRGEGNLFAIDGDGGIGEDVDGGFVVEVAH
jgi:hypothetical protein